MRGVNDDELLDFVEMTREKPINVRFIEFMPFDGNKFEEKKVVSYCEAKERILEKYPSLTRMRSQERGCQELQVGRTPRDGQFRDVDDQPLLRRVQPTADHGRTGT